MAWPGVRKALSTGALMVGITILLFLLLEGAASVAFSGYTLFFGKVDRMEAEQSHAEYDELLGWINRPNLRLPNLYGPGIGFRSNSQRFRADRDYPAAPPAGVTRVICSGDSFTMGHSVSNDEAWCAQLGAMVPNLETVNMGMAAYGVDQAFLWYRRDGAPLRHHMQILAFITGDFQRMGLDNFGGYPKPYLRVVEGRLEAANVPVPRIFSAIPRLQRQRAALMKLNVVQLGVSVMRRLGVESSERERLLLDDTQIQAAAAKAFEELQALNRAKGSTLVLVYLPRTGDKNSRVSDPWRAFVRQEADRLGIRFIDLVEAFRELPLDDGEQLFIKPYQPSHYNVRGNAWVARELRARLFPAAGVSP